MAGIPMKSPIRVIAKALSGIPQHFAAPLQSAALTLYNFEDQKKVEDQKKGSRYHGG